METRILNRLVAAFLVAAAFTPFLSSASAASDERPAVMVLGTFHFRGSTTDAISVTMGDMKSSRRQAEIKDLVKRLKTFAPTKIALELPSDRQDTLNETYRKYLSGKHELSAGEGEQIGMRLAKKLGHDKLYAVDFRQDMDMQRVLAAAGAAGQTDKIAWFQKTVGEIDARMKQVQSADNTVLDALRVHNGELLEIGNQLYLQLATFGTAEDPAGAEVIAKWYERNLKIYANIARLADSPKDRILVIFGSGHGPHLTSFFDQNPEFDLVPAMSVLGD